LTTANFYDPLPHLHATGRPSLPNQKHHQLDFFFSVLSNVHQTLTGETLSPDSIKIPALSALFGDVHSSQSKQHRQQLDLLLSISRDVHQTLSGELLSPYFIKIPTLSALFGVVRSSPSIKQQRQLELSLSDLRDIRQTLIDEALSSYSITLLPLSALFGDVHASQSKQQERKLEFSLSDLCYVRLMLTKTQRLKLSKFDLSDTRGRSIISLLLRSSLTLRNCLDFSSTALCVSSRWQHQQQHCPSLLNLDRYALLTATLPSLV